MRPNDPTRPHRRARVSARSLALAAGVLAGCGHAVVAPPPPAACPTGTFPIAGACVGVDDAAGYCGKAAKPEAGGCATRQCPDGAPTDLESGICVPALTVRRLVAATGRHAHAEAANARGREGEGQSEGDAGSGTAPSENACGVADAGQVVARLVVEGDHLACLPRGLTCGRGARAGAEANPPDDCRADPACPKGAVPDESGQCVSVVGRSHGEDVLDVGTWLRLVVGPDGGNGSEGVCGPVVERPWLTGTAVHGTGVVDLKLELVFPDNDVSAARVVVTTARPLDPHDTEPRPPLTISKYFEPLWKVLRLVGGVAGAASATVHVRCTVNGGSEPTSPPHPIRGARDAGGVEDASTTTR